MTPAERAAARTYERTLSVLRYLGEHGPSTAAQCGKALTPTLRHHAGALLLVAQREGRVVPAGETKAGFPLWAITPEGCAWLDAHDEPDTAAEAAE